MPVKFDNKPIFGQAIKVIGPIVPAFRVQSEQLPGVSGERIYRLGGPTKTWTVTGRLTGFTQLQIYKQIDAGNAYNDGQLYVFMDGAGQRFINCLLNSFVPTGNVDRTDFGWTQVISATIKQVAPAKQTGLITIT